jgi:hypothetical protein
MSEQETTPRPQSRGRRLLRWMILGLVSLITLVALIHAVENFRGQRAWNRYRQNAEARGVKLDWTAHIPQPIPDEENGANTPLIQSWFPKPKPDDTRRWPTNYYTASDWLTVHRRTKGPGSQDDRFLTDMAAWQQAFARLPQARSKTDDKIEIHSHDTARDPQEQATAARAVLAGLQPYDPALAELRTMSVRRKARYPINYQTEQPFMILLPHLAKMKSITQVLNLRACAELAAGRTNEAFESVTLMLWVGDSLQEEMFLISQLVRIAGQQIATQPFWEGLARHQWSEAQLKEMQERFLRVDFISALDRTLADERAGCIAAIDWVLKKKNPAEAFALFNSDELPVNSSIPADSLFGRLIPSGWFYFEKANVGEFMDRLTTGTWDLSSRVIYPRTVDENNRQFLDRIKRGPMDAFWNHYIFAKMLLPALEKSSVKFARAQSTANQAALACALERHWLAHGKYPEALTELVPKFIAKIPNEVVSDQPMRYRRTEQGFTLYSAGWDGTDDGGTLLRSAKNNETEKGDWVWQNAP